MKFTRFIFAFAIGILLLSCTNTSESDLIEQIEPEDVITYTEHIKPIYDNNCINCHSNPAINGASMPFTTLSELRNSIENTDHIDRINRQPGEGGFMPLGGTRLPQVSIDLIVQWQTEGFAE
jgi:mono/diheme cytochrome c family protein